MHTALDNWKASAALRDRIAQSALLRLLNRVRIQFSLSGRRDRAFFQNMRGTNNRILDFGCGGGRYYLEKFGNVIGVDQEQSLLSSASRHYYETQRFTGLPLPFRSDTLDYVVTSDVIGHIDSASKPKLLSEFYRVLRPGGITIHCIETDAQVSLVRFAKRFPNLYQEHFVDVPNHIGLQLASQVYELFSAVGFTQIKMRRLSGYIQSPGALSNYFNNEYKRHSRLLRFLLLADRLFSCSVVIAELVNLLLEPIASLEDSLLSIDTAVGISLVAQKPS